MTHRKDMQRPSNRMVQREDVVDELSVVFGFQDVGLMPGFFLSCL